MRIFLTNKSVLKNNYSGAVKLTGREILDNAVKILGTHKAEDVKAIDIAGISIIADYFLLASGASSTQVKALAEELEFRLSQMGVEPLRVEGAQSATWIILDYGAVVIHIFHRDTRKFYNLERLWADGRDVDVSGLLSGGGDNTAGKVGASR